MTNDTAAPMTIYLLDNERDDPPKQHESPVAGLGGVTHLIKFEYKVDISNAVRRLTTCKEHDGSHHFAVVSEGKSLACSVTGVTCLDRASMLHDARYVDGTTTEPVMFVDINPDEFRIAQIDIATIVVAEEAAQKRHVELRDQIMRDENVERRHWELVHLVQSNVTYKDGYRLLLEHDKTDPAGRLYFQVECDRPDIYTKEMGVGRGGKAYLSKHMIESEMVRLAYGLFARYDEHETREWFQYRGRSVFGPHIAIDAMWEASAHLDFREAQES